MAEDKYNFNLNGIGEGELSQFATTNFSEVVAEYDSKLKDLGVTDDDLPEPEVAPVLKYPLTMDTDYPIKIQFKSYSIDFRGSPQWEKIEEAGEELRNRALKAKDNFLENPTQTIAVAGGSTIAGATLGSFIPGVSSTEGGAVGAIAGLAIASGEAGNVANSFGEIIKQGVDLTSYDNYTNTNDLKGTVTLPLQRGLQYNDKVTYSTEATNFGAGFISAAASLIDGENGDLNDASVGGISRIVARVAGGGAGARLGKIAGMSAAGAVLGGVGAETLSNFAKEVSRTSMNPNLRTLFDGVPMRSFAFPFRMVAKSEAEAEEIRSIVRFFRAELYPEAINAGVKENIPFAYKFPNVFHIELKDSTGNNPAFKIQRCYLNGVTATFNQTATGMYKGSKGDYFIEVDMSLEFLEIAAMDKGKVEGGF